MGGRRRSYVESKSPAAFWVLSGKDGAELASFHVEDGVEQFPTRIGRADDRDSDGAADLWLELPKRRVVLWSGKTRKITRDASEAERQLAFEVPEVGDFDGDGVADRRRVADGWTFLFSGRDGSTLWECDRVFERVLVLGPYGTQAKPVLLCVDTSRFGFGEGHVELRTGVGAISLWSVTDDGHFQHFGAAIDVLDDVDSDAVNDWIVGGSNILPSKHARMHVRSGVDGRVLMEFERRGRAVFRLR